MNEASPGSPRSASGEQAEAAAPVVLVAEDEDSLRGMLTLLLKRLGYVAIMCSDGAQAVAALDGAAHIDGALLDLRMPGVDGMGVLQHARGLPWRAELPIIAMSAFSDDYQARAVLSAGANGFLRKPFTIDELATALAALVPHPSDS